MATTNFSFATPTVGGSEDTWGADLNANWTAVDGILYGSSTIRPDLATGLWKVGGTLITSTAAELNRLDGLTSNAQAQLNAKQALDAGLTSIAGLTTAANRMIYTTAADTYAVATLTSYARTLLDDADAAAVRSTLGIGDGFLDSANLGVFASVDENGVYYSSTSDPDIPGTAANHMFVHCEITSDIAGQFAIDLSTLYPYVRRKASGTWSDWTNLAGMGVGQTWQDMSGSRSGTSTAYQNTTGRPLNVLIQMTNANSHDVDVSSDGSTWITLATGDTDVNGRPFSFIVPPGHYYRYTGGAYVGWLELR